MPYPERMTVFPFPNHGTFHANPTEGAKLLLSFPLTYAPMLGWVEFFPTNCTCVRFVQFGKPLAKRLEPGTPSVPAHWTFRKALSSPMTRAARPSCSYG